MMSKMKSQITAAVDADVAAAGEDAEREKRKTSLRISSKPLRMMKMPLGSVVVAAANVVARRSSMMRTSKMPLTVVAVAVAVADVVTRRNLCESPGLRHIT